MARVLGADRQNTVRCQVRHRVISVSSGAYDLVGQEGRITVARVPENRLASVYAQAQASIYSDMALISGSMETRGAQKTSVHCWRRVAGEKQVS